MFEFIKRKFRNYIRYNIAKGIEEFSTANNADKILTVLSGLERFKMLESIPSSRLEHHEFSTFSQHGEDGILCEIFKRIGTANKIFVEIGVDTGVENNTHLLLESGWKGLWIEGSKEHCGEIRKNFEAKLKDRRLSLEECFVTKDNINETIAKHFTGEVDLFSLDIDGNDYYILDQITAISPRVVVTEYNGNFFPPARMVIEYDPNFVWQKDDYYGASLQVFADWFQEHGYSLVCCDLSGTNAFWVRNDLFTKERFPYSTEIDDLYHPPRYYSVGSKGHPASSKWDSLEKESD